MVRHIFFSLMLFISAAGARADLFVAGGGGGAATRCPIDQTIGRNVVNIADDRANLASALRRDRARANEIQRQIEAIQDNLGRYKVIIRGRIEGGAAEMIFEHMDRGDGLNDDVCPAVIERQQVVHPEPFHRKAMNDQPSMSRMPASEPSRDPATTEAVGDLTPTKDPLNDPPGQLPRFDAKSKVAEATSKPASDSEDAKTRKLKAAAAKKIKTDAAEQAAAEKKKGGSARSFQANAPRVPEPNANVVESNDRVGGGNDRVVEGNDRVVEGNDKVVEGDVGPYMYPPGSHLNEHGHGGRGESPYCVGGENMWKYYAKTFGEVDVAVCAHNFKIHVRGSADRIRPCQRAIHDYYADVRRIHDLQMTLDRYEARGRGFEREMYHMDLGGDEAGLAGGIGGCRTCALNNNVMALAMGSMSVLMQMRNGMNGPRYPYAPGRRPSAFNYNSPNPHFMNVRNGFYGGVQGGTGQGVFGCNGLNNPNLFDNPYSVVMVPQGRQFGAPNVRPWPSAMNGAGPGWRYPPRPMPGNRGLQVRPMPGSSPTTPFFAGNGLGAPGVLPLGGAPYASPTYGAMLGGQLGQLNNTANYINSGVQGPSRLPVVPAGVAQLQPAQVGSSYAPRYAPLAAY
jgi:hypothetical protein